MSKKILKENLKERQNGKSNRSNQFLPPEQELWDASRHLPKSQGGDLTLENTEGILPKETLEKYDNLRIRQEELEHLKCLIDARRQIMKLLISSDNRLLAYHRWVDNLDKDTVEFLEEQSKNCRNKLNQLDSKIKKYLNKMHDPIIKVALNVKGVGPITVAYMLVYVDINKTEYVSCLWAYAGIHTPAKDRYKKGETSGGNKTLRTILYTMATSMIKTGSPYREVYDNEKKKLENSKKIINTRTTKGWVEKE